MRRIVLHHDGQAIPLPAGDTLIGRALDCRVRFNDPAVSRRHVRLVVRDEGVVAENLSATNGTLINGVVIVAPVTLVDGDVLRIGHRKVTVELGGVVRGRTSSSPPTFAQGRELAPGIFADDEDVAAEETRPGEALGAGGALRALTDGLKEHTCPRCRASTSYFDDVCPRCGYAWPPGRPSSRTQEIAIEVVSVRAHPRYAVEVPVVYASESLGIDAIVRDLSRGGMFIATDLLDPVGTPCEVTALPDGHSAVRFAGVVAHVVQEANALGRPSGLGIRFTLVSPEAEAWLERVVAGFERASAEPSPPTEATVDVALVDE